MILKRILLEAIREVDSSGLDAVLEFPNENFTVSIFRPEKRLEFIPQEHSSLPSKIRTFINMLKERFAISKINNLDDEEDEHNPADNFLRGAFDVYIAPTEDFEAVVDFLKQSVDAERE